MRFDIRKNFGHVETRLNSSLSQESSPLRAEEEFERRCLTRSDECLLKRGVDIGTVEEECVVMVVEEMTKSGV